MAIRKDTVILHGVSIDVHSMNTLVVGTGAAGFHAAECLYALGQTDIAMLTEGVDMGTSRNAGSDKQTYHKLTMAGGNPDSVEEMTKTLFEGGAVHGDIALVQAALSARCFLHLADIGVPFPQNRFGEYIGYQTDHDARLRATSAGPLTSRIMTERLEAQVRQKGIRIFDRFLAIGILTTPLTEKDTIDVGLPAGKVAVDDRQQSDRACSAECAECSAIGLIALDLDRLESPSHGIALFNCTNLVYATGGPGGMYRDSVYPESQTGAMGIALEAGALAVNLTESQYGIASVKFRWNLSGTYQQVLPRYMSTDREGKDAREFLADWYQDTDSMLDAIFLKGYQWPFDPAKTGEGGSSVIDLLVGLETARGRRVFLDFTHNPGTYSVMGTADSSGCQSTLVQEALDFTRLRPEAHAYLERSGALFGCPIDRLRHMNAPALELFRSHGIDLETEWLEIAVCAQHANGGLVGNIWWESNLRHFFPIGEVNGSFGIRRPGGSALNATQVGGLRAAEFIAARYRESPMPMESFLTCVEKQVSRKTALAEALLHQPEPVRIMVAEPVRIMVAEPAGQVQVNRDETPIHAAAHPLSVRELRDLAGARMSAVAAQIRPVSELEAAMEEALRWALDFPSNIRLDGIHELPDAFRLRDILLTRFVFLPAICGYVKYGGGSRGSSLITESGFRAGKGRNDHFEARGMNRPPMDNEADDRPVLPGALAAQPENPTLRDKACEVMLCAKPSETGGLAGLAIEMHWRQVRPVPPREDWFETEWQEYRNGSRYI